MPDLAPMDAEQVALIKRTVARGTTDDELKLFLHACARTGLDPLMKQIYAVKRYDATLKRDVMAIQTGIDGLRLVADRTGLYAPGREPSFTYDPPDDPRDGALLSATAYIKKQTRDGTWHEIAATAHFDEYVQRTRDGGPTRFWKQMPHVMLAKVAEALALRRAFPMELSGVYSTEEMTQADSDAAADEKHPRLRGPAAPVSPAPRPDAEATVTPPDDPPAAAPVLAATVTTTPGTDEVPNAEEPVSPLPTPSVSEKAVRALEASIRKLARLRGRRDDQMRDIVKQSVLDRFGKEHFHELTRDEFDVVVGWVAGRTLRPMPEEEDTE
jgi:phage recombination protein Bet